MCGRISKIATAVSVHIIIKIDRSRREILIGHGRAQFPDGRSTGATAAKSTHHERWSARQSERRLRTLTHIAALAEFTNTIECAYSEEVLQNDYVQPSNDVLLWISSIGDEADLLFSIGQNQTGSTLDYRLRLLTARESTDVDIRSKSITPAAYQTSPRCGRSRSL